MLTVISTLLALLGISFLIFIHELGHLLMARRAKMTVEVFSIGFGKPIRSWQWKGITWQLCFLPFGGYVRIKGMEKKGIVDPYQVPDGFYGKKPLSRILVAFMGPFFNIAFAFLAFTMIWFTGGREKKFSEFTHLIGGVERDSSLYALGVRAGDSIDLLNQKPYEGFSSIAISVMLSGKPDLLEGRKLDYFANMSAEPFQYVIPRLEAPAGSDQEILPPRIPFIPAEYVIYDVMKSKGKPIEDTPIQKSGIQYKDRLLWVDGDLVFSTPQIRSLVNQPKSLLTVQRGSERIVTLVPRLKIADLRLGRQERGELDDWMHQSRFASSKLNDLYFIPYNLTSDAVVENPFVYLNDKSEEQQFLASHRAPFEVDLQRGDRILAVDGRPIASSSQLFGFIQEKRSLVIVQREKSWQPISWKEEDKLFFAGVNWADLKEMILSIGSQKPIEQKGNLVLLDPIVPQTFSQLPITTTMHERLEQEWLARQEEAEKMENPQEKEAALRSIERERHTLLLGLQAQDRKVIYNPSPLQLFAGSLGEIKQTLGALFSGQAKPKQLMGPVGIVQVVQQRVFFGLNEMLFWLGVISLNLAVINLFPLPVLDGGQICFSLYEMATKRRLSFKTMERFILPFVILLIGFFLYVTYNDLARLFVHWMK